MPNTNISSNRYTDRNSRRVLELPEEKIKEVEWIVKKESSTDPKYGVLPEKRTVEEKIKNGLVIIDKPYGPTSHQVSAWVRDILGLKKAGHAGTLDPNAVGVLPIALENATKVLYAMKVSKEYVGLMKLGKELNENKIKEGAERFVGVSRQIPPELSAVKRVERERIIYYLNILEVNGREVLFKIGCEAGFYVRVFCEQFGKSLRTKGTMEELRRTKVGLFKENDAVYFQDLVDEFKFWKNGAPSRIDKIIMPVEAGVKHLKKVVVKDNTVNALCFGAPLAVNGISMLQENIAPGELVAVLTLKGELVCLSEALMNSEGILNAEKGIAAKTIRVFMPRNTYPKRWST